jgi:hypothetical protein
MPGVGISSALQSYFEPYHGHGVVDAQGYVPGVMLRKEVPQLPPGKQPPQCAEDCYEWFTERRECPDRPVSLSLRNQPAPSASWR